MNAWTDNTEQRHQIPQPHILALKSGSQVTKKENRDIIKNQQLNSFRKKTKPLDRYQNKCFFCWEFRSNQVQNKGISKNILFRNALKLFCFA
jgi:hypothetical protein